MNQPVIELERYEIERYNFIKQNIEDYTNEDPFKITVESGITEDLNHGRVKVMVNYETSEVSILLDVVGYFRVNDKSDSEKITEYLVVNGTAIIFPYLRSMISMLSSLDSENAIIIPTINTVNLFKPTEWDVIISEISIFEKHIHWFRKKLN